MSEQVPRWAAQWCPENQLYVLDLCLPTYRDDVRRKELSHILLHRLICVFALRTLMAISQLGHTHIARAKHTVYSANA